MNKTLTIEATLKNWNEVNEFLEDLTKNYPPEASMAIKIVVEEIFANVANYAYAPNVVLLTINVESSDSPEKITFTFIDSGIAFNPLEKSEPDFSISYEEKEVGGLGIFLLRENADEIKYEYRDGKNILSVTKFLN